MMFVRYGCFVGYGICFSSNIRIIVVVNGIWWYLYISGRRMCYDDVVKFVKIVKIGFGFWLVVW